MEKILVVQWKTEFSCENAEWLEVKKFDIKLQRRQDRVLLFIDVSSKIYKLTLFDLLLEKVETTFD